MSHHERSEVIDRVSALRNAGFTKQVAIDWLRTEGVIPLDIKPHSITMMISRAKKNGHTIGYEVTPGSDLDYPDIEYSSPELVTPNILQDVIEAAAVRAMEELDLPQENVPAYIEAELYRREVIGYAKVRTGDRAPRFETGGGASLTEQELKLYPGDPNERYVLRRRENE